MQVPKSVSHCCQGGGGVGWNPERYFRHTQALEHVLLYYCLPPLPWEKQKQPRDLWHLKDNTLLWIFFFGSRLAQNKLPIHLYHQLFFKIPSVPKVFCAAYVGFVGRAGQVVLLRKHKPKLCVSMQKLLVLFGSLDPGQLRNILCTLSLLSWISLQKADQN